MEKPKRTELIGLLAGFLTTFSFAPQVYSLWRAAPKPAPDISLWMYAMVVAGGSLWIVYGIKARSLSITLWNVIGITLTLSVLVYKLMYG